MWVVIILQPTNLCDVLCMMHSYSVLIRTLRAASTTEFKKHSVKFMLIPVVWFRFGVALGRNNNTTAASSS